VQNNSAPIVNLTGLNAGPAINITGNGTKYPLTAQSTGQYSGSTGTFSPGVYTVDNGAGGTDVGPFSASINVGSPLTWSLSGSPAAIPAGQSQTVTWSGGDPNGFVVVLGASLISVEGLGILTTFECTQNNSAGQFTIPGYITYNMSANAGTQGEIAVVGTSAATPLSAPGLDTGVVTYMSGPPGKNIGFTAGTGLKN
jgi:hypothetical protein